MAAKRRPIASNGAFNVVGHFDFRDVDAAFRSLERAGQAHRALKDLRGPVRRDLVRHAKAQTGPGGHWKPRAPSTVKRARRSKNRRRVKGPNRKLLNSLPRRSVEITTTGDRLIAASKVPWSAIHQEGGVAGHGARIPARPFLWLSDEFYRDAKSVLVKRLYDAWLKG